MEYNNHHALRNMLCRRHRCRRLFVEIVHCFSTLPDARAIASASLNKPSGKGCFSPSPNSESLYRGFVVCMAMWPLMCLSQDSA